jgi:hypothetical protein
MYGINSYLERIQIEILIILTYFNIDKIYILYHAVTEHVTC